MSKAFQKALDAVLGKQAYTVDLARNSQALGALLDDAKADALFAQLSALARELAALPESDDISSRPKSMLVSERSGQIRMLAASLRYATTGYDLPIAELVRTLRDGRVRRDLAEVLRGDYYELEPTAREELARLVDDTSVEDQVVLRCGLQSLFDLDPQAAEARYRQLLAGPIVTPHDAAVAHEIMTDIETREAVLQRLAPYLFPLVVSSDNDVATTAQRLVTMRRQLFLDFLAWVLANEDAVEMTEIVVDRLYWEGERDEEVADAWSSLGALDVGPGGVVVLDATESGKEKGFNRSAVALPSGRYDVLAHTPQGFGGDLTAVRIGRQES
ncbi:MAG: hypothetical protein H0T89_00515 [Deltaproteobacteria bacterium]|nr:hypothetical protein [Deltaproteobacteria bacterium]